MNDPYIYLYAIAFLLSLGLTVIVEKAMIPKLKALGGQPIYEGGPSWHSKKSGTPTMGGLGFVTVMVLALTPAGILFIQRGRNDEGIALLLCLGFALLNSLVGIIDDGKKLKRRQNEGLKPYQKLILQTVFASLFLLLRALLLDDSGIGLNIFGIKLGAFYYPLAVLILVGITNFANLTDGIDGLASGVAIGIGISFFYISYSLSYSTTMICSSLIGAILGFLIFNIHPAKIFMGDTGSLFLGALAIGMGFTLESPAVLLPSYGVYIAEGLSVILQVGFYKLTKRRIFKMAPLHHHLEKCGWSENRICIVAIVLTVLTSIPAYAFYLP